MNRTTIAVRVPTRDRVTAAARAADMTIDNFITRLLDEREESEFWAAMRATSPEEYEAAARQDGVWPGDYDYTAEVGALQRDEDHA
ncbi:MAG: hypothetical protein LBJ44_08855 [Propionibacteriaceae bacterium]|jgi:hypothetical protein|nr:hypothetical protein [Propionibacteriaceae bacterium]